LLVALFPARLVASRCWNHCCVDIIEVAQVSVSLLQRRKNFGVRTFQAEDEIAAIAATVGAAFAGQLSWTGTSGPGLALKSEALSLAMMTELPMVVIDVQRGGPSTGLPTKPEQSDLLFAMYGRHGESPLPVLAIASPSDAYDTAIEAARIALKYMTPVILLSDNNVATGSEPWKLPSLADLPPASVQAAKALMRRKPEPVEERIAAEGKEFSARLSSEEFTEAASAFMARRKPDFSKFE